MLRGFRGAESIVPILLGVALAVPAAVPVVLCAADPTRAAAAEEPGGTVTLSTALASALLRSPHLSAYSWQLRASEAQALQAGLRLNPEVGVEIEDLVGRAGYREARQAQTTFRLSQVIELGGKRDARHAVAEAMRDLAAQDYEVQRVEVLAEAAECFVQVAGLQQQLRLTREASETALTALRAVRLRVAAGNLSSLEEKKALIALARRRIDEEHAVHELAAARHRLAATWGSTSPQFERVDGDLFALQELPSFEELSAQVARSPEIKRWVSDRKVRDAEVALADAKGIPNLTAIAGVRRLEGPDAETMQLQFSIPLPIFDRNQGGAAEARSAVQHAEANRRATEIRLQTVLFGLYQELVHAATSVKTLQGDIQPEAEAALSLSQRGFDEGRSAYLELLDAQRTLVEVRQEAIASAVTYHQLLLSIERLLGQPVDVAAAAR